MGDFLKKAKELGAKALEEAKDAGETGKLKLSIQGKKGDIKDAFLAIGEIIYNKYLEGGEEGIPSEIMKHIKDIDGFKAEIAELEKKIEEVNAD